MRQDRLQRYCMICGQLIGVITDSMWRRMYHCCEDKGCLVLYEARLGLGKETGNGCKPRQT